MPPSLEKWMGLPSRLSLISRARELLHLGSPYPEEQPAEAAVNTVYQKPVVTRLTAEQARLVLIGHATFGDPGAMDLMKTIFRDAEIRGGGCLPGSRSPEECSRSALRDCA